MSLFLLDTNMASFAMKRHYQAVRTHLARAAKKHGIGISAVTQGELIYGLHRKDAPNELVELIRGFPTNPIPPHAALVFLALCSLALRGEVTSVVPLGIVTPPE